MSIGLRKHYEIFQNIFLSCVKYNFGVFLFVNGVYSIEIIEKEAVLLLLLLIISSYVNHQHDNRYH